MAYVALASQFLSVLDHVCGVYLNGRATVGVCMDPSSAAVLHARTPSQSCTLHRGSFVLAPLYAIGFGLRLYSSGGAFTIVSCAVFVDHVHPFVSLAWEPGMERCVVAVTPLI
eukprot:6197685-Pleurochrysis_carterae.AAC.1